MNILDISPLVDSKIAVWPGDTPLRREILCNIEEGANIDLSTIHATVHLGAHADAPHHYHLDGESIDCVALEPYIGRCIVISVPRHRAQILKEDCLKAVEAEHTRVLFRTLSAPDRTHFNQDFISISPEATEYLGLNGIVLVGIDTPSVDPFDSKELPAHQMLYKYKIKNLEGLSLEHVQDGVYELIALPLKLAGFDASPVRAILRAC